jgi:hypothetical protein
VGQRRSQTATHESQWDYVGFTNAGVVPGWDGISSVIDSQAPSIPSNVQASAQTPKMVKVTWIASTDNVGVAGYKVYRNGTQLGTTTATIYSDTGLTPNTTYSYTVSAYDAAGNNSGQSAPAVVTTPAASSIVGVKSLPDGSAVGLVSKTVTAIYGGSLYVEESDRSTGIKVVPVSVPPGLAVGNLVDIGGTLQTANGERYIGGAALTVN